MNARMKVALREHAGLFVVPVDGPGNVGRLQAGKWARLQDGLKRMLLLLRSPIASFSWARAKRRVTASKKQNSASNWQGRRSNSLAECERDGIVMGF